MRPRKASGSRYERQSSGTSSTTKAKQTMQINVAAYLRKMRRRGREATPAPVPGSSANDFIRSISSVLGHAGAAALRCVTIPYWRRPHGEEISSCAVLPLSGEGGKMRQMLFYKGSV